eukprot:2532907-Pyramimonas_sp.AAC.1
MLAMRAACLPAATLSSISSYSRLHVPRSFVSLIELVAVGGEIGLSTIQSPKGEWMTDLPCLVIASVDIAGNSTSAASAEI